MMDALYLTKFFIYLSLLNWAVASLAKTIRIQLPWSFACHFLRARWDNVAEILRKWKTGITQLNMIKIVSSCRRSEWRYWLTSSAVNRKVGGSSPPGDGSFCSDLQKIITNNIFYIVSVRSPCIHPVSVKFSIFTCKKIFTNEQPLCKCYVNKLLLSWSWSLSLLVFWELK